MIVPMDPMGVVKFKCAWIVKNINSHFPLGEAVLTVSNLQRVMNVRHMTKNSMILDFSTRKAQHVSNVKLYTRHLSHFRWRQAIFLLFICLILNEAGSSQAPQTNCRAKEKHCRNAWPWQRFTHSLIGCNNSKNLYKWARLFPLQSQLISVRTICSNCPCNENCILQNSWFY